MILALSLMSLIAGTSLACAAQRMPTYCVRFEQVGGTLFASGLTLLGTLLSPIC